MKFPKAGHVIKGHSHNFDHTTYVIKGTILIEELDDLGKVIASTIKTANEGLNWVLIKAKVIHRLTSLEDAALGHCIYAHRSPQGDVVQEYNGWEPASGVVPNGR